MGRGLGVGPGSMAGLKWLARIGPCPLDAWRSAMGWSEVAARSHAKRLEDRGWLARQPMVRGDGCLFWATGAGSREARVAARPVRRVTPALWSRHCAVAWVASWIRFQESHLLGPREILQLPEWAVRLRWRDHFGSHEAIHRPDLIAIPADGEYCAAVEVEVTRTSPGRLRENLRQHYRWQADGDLDTVFYVCADKLTADRVRKYAKSIGLTEGDGALVINLLNPIRADVMVRHNNRPRVTTSERSRPSTASRTPARPVVP